MIVVDSSALADRQSGSGELEFTKHAAHVMAERLIALEWVKRAVAEPELRDADPNDPEVEHFFRHVPKRSDRVLRVVVNTDAVPWRVVTVFFDRRMRGML